MTTQSRQQTSPAPIDPVRGLGYRGDIDGLRGVAILLVLLFHAGVPWVRGGYSGVDIFFVISGYLIGFQVSSELEQQRFALLPFYQKRVRRILPALLVVSLFSLLAGWLLFDGRELRVLAEQAGAATVSLSNVYYWATTSYFSPNAHLQTLLMTWSLGIEVQFYLLLPLIAVALYRRSRDAFLGLIVVSLLLSFAYATLGMHHAWPSAFFLLGERWWELAAGVVLGVVEVRAHRAAFSKSSLVSEACGVIGLIGVAVCVALPEPRAQLLMPPVCIAIAAAILLCLSAASWVNRRLLNSSPLSALGRRSYSVYLWHWPLLSLGYLCGAGYLSETGRLALLALTFVFAEISYRYVELPFRRPRSKTNALQAIAAMGALVLLVSTALYLAHGWPKRNPIAAMIEASVHGDAVARRCLAGDAGTVAMTPAICIPSGATVALLGDSHAAALAPAVRQLSSPLAMWMKTSCPPLLDVTIRAGGPDRCSAYEGDAVAHVAADTSIGTVLVAGYWLNPIYDPTREMRYVASSDYGASTSEDQSWVHLHDGLLALCLKLRAAHKTVVLVEDVPIQSYDPHLLAIGNTLPLRAQLGRWLAFAPSGSDREPHRLTRDEIHMHALLQNVAEESASRIVSLYRPLCDGTTCAIMSAGMPFYEDRQHLSILGAQTLLQPSGLAAVLQSSTKAAMNEKPEAAK